MNSTSEPRYRNYCDCGKCKFLGTHKEDDRDYDLYFCPSEVPGLYVRFGNDAVEVEGMPAESKNIPGYVLECDRRAFFRAMHLAEVQGLI